MNYCEKCALISDRAEELEQVGYDSLSTNIHFKNDRNYYLYFRHNRENFFIKQTYGLQISDYIFIDSDIKLEKRRKISFDDVYNKGFKIQKIAEPIDGYILEPERDYKICRYNNVTYEYESKTFIFNNKLTLQKNLYDLGGRWEKYILHDYINRIDYLVCTDEIVLKPNIYIELNGWYYKDNSKYIYNTLPASCIRITKDIYNLNSYHRFSPGYPICDSEVTYQLDEPITISKRRYNYLIVHSDSVISETKFVKINHSRFFSPYNEDVLYANVVEKLDEKKRRRR